MKKSHWCLHFSDSILEEKYLCCTLVQGENIYVYNPYRAQWGFLSRELMLKGLSLQKG